MTTTGNLSGNEIPKRLFKKLTKKERRKVLRDAILKFEKDKKSGKSNTAGDIIRRKNLEEM